MTRRDDHFDAMLKHLGATYYRTLQGQATPSDVARALDSVDREAARRHETPADPRAVSWGRGLKTGRWRVRDVMTANVITVDRSTTGGQIARLLSKHHIHAVPVITGGRRVAGIVAEGDLLRTQHRPRKRAAIRLPGRGSARPAVEAHSAARLMTSPAVTIHPDAPIGVAARRMSQQHLTLLPVVDAAGELIGVVSRRDLLSVFLRPDSELAAEVADILAHVLLVDSNVVTVSAHEGVVTLSGEIHPAHLAQVAVELAGDVDGVLAVEDRLSNSTAVAQGG